jgi:GcrA cell cycle regulator
MTTPSQIEQQARSYRWPQEHWDLCLELWTDGRSASEVARELTAKFGVERTRKSVLGKLDRMNAPSHGTPQRKNTKAGTGMSKSNFIRAPRRTDTDRSRAGKENAAAASIVRRALNRSPVPLPPKPLPFFEEPLVGLIDQLVDLTEHTCKWPIGDPLAADFTFCGREPQPGKPYCPAHMLRAYTAPAPITESRQKSIYPTMRSQHA